MLHHLVRLRCLGAGPDAVHRQAVVGGEDQQLRVAERGLSVFCISPRRMASGSSSPRQPPAGAAPAQLVAQVRSSCGLEVGETSERLGHVMVAV
jgi:hypothetical protein